MPIAREIDRAALPFLGSPGKPPVLHAHRIILLVPPTPMGRRVGDKVAKALKAVAAVEQLELDSEKGGRSIGFQRLLSQISRLCVRELEAGNRVHINLSSGTKLVAFAAGLAGMAHIRPGLGSVYYVQPEGFTLSESDFEHHGHTKGVADVEELELMPVLLPEPAQLRVLAYLRYQPEGRANYRDLLEYLGTVPESEYAPAPKGSSVRIRNWNNAATTRMVRKLLTPLHEDGLIEILALGGQKACQLTNRGLLYVSVAGLTKDDLRKPFQPQHPHHPLSLVDALKA